MKISASLSPLLLLSLLGTTGCLGRVLVWTPSPPTGPPEGRIYLLGVSDFRTAQRGGATPQLIGRERGGVGAHSEIRVGSKEELLRTVARYVRDTAASAGLGATSRQYEATALVSVAIEDLFCEGRHKEFEAAMVLKVTVRDPRTSQVRAEESFRGQTRQVGPFGDCAVALQKMMQEQFGRVVGFWQQPEMYISARGAAGPVVYTARSKP